jgi:hypothetical protein
MAMRQATEEELRFMLKGSHLSKQWRANVEKALAGEGAIYHWWDERLRGEWRR